MKKIIKTALTTFALCFALVLALGTANEVSAKQKFSYKLKKGTLTIKGKGNMPAKKNFKNNKKIKKVVIKKGVKSISNKAFYKCKNLKKITIPSSVTKVGVDAFNYTGLTKLTLPKKVKKVGVGFADNCKKLDYLTMPGTFDFVNSKGKVTTSYSWMYGTYLIQAKFNTDLDYKKCYAFTTLNFMTSPSDKEFSTVDGCVYTKDGKGLVRVPSERTSLSIADGCEVLYTAALAYLGDTLMPRNLSSVKVPASVKTITDKKYNENSYAFSEPIKTNFSFADTTKLDLSSIVKLKNAYYIKPAKMEKMFPDRIVYDEENKVYIGDKKSLFSAGEGVNIPEGIETICDGAYKNLNDTFTEELVVPDGVKTIEANAFKNSSIIAIKLPETLTEIGEEAFRDCHNLTKINIPSKVSVINNSLFRDDYSLKDITIDGNISSIGNYSFYDTKVSLNNILKTPGLTKIGDNAFGYVSFTNITIPETVTTIGKYAFDIVSSVQRTITVDGSTNSFHKHFCGNRYLSSLTLNFTKGITESITCTWGDKVNHSKKKEKINVSWVKVSDATGYEIKYCKDAAGNKIVKKDTAKYNQSSTSAVLKKTSKTKYVFTRAYKLVEGKKVYGKWTFDEV